ncbi:MAG: ATP-grasp domain-containing protein [Bacteroidales bacterium]|nr:ATP-grasp domain-containing protein [Bacteroidales bacterium]
MRNVNILFLGGAKRVSLAEHLIESGKNHDMEISIFSYELDLMVPIASVGKVILGLKWKDKSIFEHLRIIIKENKINIVLPFVDPAIEICSKLKNEINDIFIPISSPEICHTMFDKKLSAEWFEKHDISQPIIYSDIENVSFPIILKPRNGSASKGLITAYKIEDIENNINLEDYIIQQYIGHRKEFTVDCYVAKDGRAVSIVPRERIETAGGEAIKSITVRDEDIIDESRKILSSGCFEGPITIQFIKDIDSNNNYVMEINPRFGGGVVTSIGARSGILDFLLDEYENKMIFPKDNWIEGTLMTRYFKEVIFYADNS